MVGTSAADLPCRGRVRLTGSLRVVGHDRQLVTAVELGPVAGDSRHVEGTSRLASRDRRATLANVAASAGVSVATVSKVLNGRTDVAPATRALVQELLHEHDYVARRAKPALSPAIELFFHGQLNAYHTEVLQGAVEAAADAGVAVVVSMRPRGQRGSGRAVPPRARPVSPPRAARRRSW